MIDNCSENLRQLKELTEVINENDYKQKIDLLSGASIGQHIRHILEFYLCVFEGQIDGTINYDLRKRDIRIEEDPVFAAHTINNLLISLQLLPQKHVSISLQGNFKEEESEIDKIDTSLARELAYNLEHSIHHQALIKVALLYLNRGVLVDENFGVAPATVRFRKSILIEN
ncbi:DinB family protein [Arcticibacterium luteifluviistationis]|uniref:DinB family protein n=1 Tax=Arcticibacterium luteifluviistationis TaxID=1784714 RepID=A0A2Z4GB07_9BACT|nr:DinB family protein [Arcticibacterium luteifluviistationis]AWV98469.1 hypothetical protein DJ013_09910 [Arcticibacterium luteifluviistationis]